MQINNGNRWDKTRQDNTRHKLHEIMANQLKCSRVSVLSTFFVFTNLFSRRKDLNECSALISSICERFGAETISTQFCERNSKNFFNAKSQTFSNVFKKVEKKWFVTRYSGIYIVGMFTIHEPAFSLFVVNERTHMKVCLRFVFMSSSSFKS